MEKNEASDAPAGELDGQMILRLPPPYAAKMRELLRSRNKTFHKKFRIDLKPDMRKGVVKLENHILSAKVYDLPTVIECHKTLDKKMFYKVADICQMMVCTEIEEDESDEEPHGSQNYLDREGRDKRYLYPHGVTPCLKNVRKRRFRKMLRKKYVESPSVEREVKWLIKSDSEAYSHRFELVNPEEESPKVSDSKVNGSGSHVLGERDIFGEVVSSSEDSEEADVEDNSTLNLSGIVNQSVVSLSYNDNVETLNYTLVSNETVDQEIINSNNPQSPYESEAAGVNLGKILKGQKTDQESEEFCEKLNELEREISHIRAEKRLQEIDIMSIPNQALKQRFQKNIECLKTRELEKQKEYNEIANALLET